MLFAWLQYIAGVVALRSLDLSHNHIEKIDNKTHGLLDDCLSLERVSGLNIRVILWFCKCTVYYSAAIVAFLIFCSWIWATIGSVSSPGRRFRAIRTFRTGFAKLISHTIPCPFWLTILCSAPLKWNVSICLIMLLLIYAEVSNHWCNLKVILV